MDSTDAKTTRRGIVLIVEDEADYAERYIARFFRSDYEVRFAYNVPGALALVQELPRLSLALVDLDIPGGVPFDPARPGGFGLQVVERIRSRFPLARVVVFTGHLHPNLINTSHRLGAAYLSKSGCEENLRSLARTVVATQHVINEDATRFVAQFSRAHALTKRQTEVLALALTGRSNPEIAAALGISTNTLKRHVRDILGTASEPSLEAIVRQFWREVLEP
jgi:DNA-binding NarL/FixJ family response regulator